MPLPAVAQSLPSGWATRDIGSVGAVGSSSGSGSTFTVSGAGADVWGYDDAFRFTYRTMTGNGSLVAQVSTIEQVNAWTKAGVMMRDSLTTNSPHAFMFVTPGKGVVFQRRKQPGGMSYSTTGATAGAPYSVKLVRSGDSFTSYLSRDGVSWTLVGTTTIAMADTIYVGLAVSSHVAGNVATATFASTSVSAGGSASAPPAPSSPPPATPPPSSSGSTATLRVMQWNTHHGGIGTDGRYDANRIASAIAKAAPDLVSLNEVDTLDQVNAIVNGLRATTGVTWNVSFSGLGNLMLSRLPLSGKSTCWYGTRSVGGGAYAAHASVVVNGRSVNMWSTHLNASSASSRTAEITAMHGCALNWSEARIIAGDHNMQYGSAEYLVAATGYADAWLAAKALGTATTYAGNCDGCTRNSRIDYIFTSKGAAALTVKSAQVLDTRDAQGVMPSDHKPVLVTYAVK
jgi:endonuclease/exonuclease/phosphatase family metal-dependent hydrolase